MRNFCGSMFVLMVTAASLSGCAKKVAPEPQNLDQARAKFSNHPTEEQLSPQARAIVESMKKRNSATSHP